LAARPHPNSVEYGNSKTTTLLPSAKCTRPLFQGRTGCGGRPSGWHDIVTCQRLVVVGLFKEPIIVSLKSMTAEIRYLENRYDVIFFCPGWSDKIPETGAEWHVDCGDVVEIETRCRIPIYGGRFCESNGMSSHSHVSYCRVLPFGKFTVTIPEPHATLQGVRIPSAILKIVFRYILFYFVFDRLQYTCYLE